MKKIILDQDKIAYLRKGEVGKPKLLMLHGLFANNCYFREAIEHFKNDFDILVPDFPGFGLSDRFRDKKHTISNYAEVVVKLCDHFDFKPFYLIGASMGGMIGIWLTNKYPSYVRKLVIQSSPFAKSCINIQYVEKALNLVSKISSMVKIVHGVKSKINRKVFIKLLQNVNKHYLEIEKKTGAIYYCFKTMDLSATSEAWHDIRSIYLAQKARGIKKPTLVIVGDLDVQIFPQNVQLLSKLIKGSKFKLIKGGTHALFWDYPEKMASIVKKFLLDTSGNKYF